MSSNLAARQKDGWTAVEIKRHMQAKKKEKTDRQRADVIHAL